MRIKISMLDLSVLLEDLQESTLSNPYGILKLKIGTAYGGNFWVELSARQVRALKNKLPIITIGQRYNDKS